MTAHKSDEIVAYLARNVSQGATAVQIAQTVASAVDGIDRALAPVFGTNGVAALCKRSIHVAGQRHSCLATLAVSESNYIAALETALEEQTAADAAAAGAAFLQSFHQLLSILVGLSLAERLLRPVWTNFLSGPSAKGPEA